MQTNSNKIDAIVYPGMTSHPTSAWISALPFHGNYFVIQFNPKYRTIRMYQRFVSAVLREAKKQGVDLVSGTSFGLNTTRIYLTALRADTAEPFIRVSVGMENRSQIEKLKEVFIQTINRL